jgi:hypothetical protein
LTGQGRIGAATTTVSFSWLVRHYSRLNFENEDAEKMVPRRKGLDATQEMHVPADVHVHYSWVCVYCREGLHAIRGTGSHGFETSASS